MLREIKTMMITIIFANQSMTRVLSLDILKLLFTRSQFRNFRHPPSSGIRIVLPDIKGSIGNVSLASVLGDAD